jgi:type II secretory pathway component GspD/PulD (secretin)
VRETKSTQESKVSWLSDIPGLGKLFTSTQDVDERSLYMINEYKMHKYSLLASVNRYE